MAGLRTGELAGRAGVNVETIRFYERRGLLPRPPRTAAGYRAYSPEFVRRVRFIKRAQDLGFSLREVKELLALRAEPGTTCGDVRRQAEAKLADIADKIADLQRMKKALYRLSAACRGGGLAKNGCPILDALDAEEAAETETETKSKPKPPATTAKSAGKARGGRREALKVLE